MNSILQQLLRLGGAPSPWQDTTPVRAEIFGVERLERHAASLAVAQRVSATPARVRSLRSRLDDNATALLRAYRVYAREVEGGRELVPAAAWLLDNYHLVEAQVREIRADLPPGLYRQLPKLEGGPLRGYPRVLGIAWAFVAHTDSHLDPTMLRRFLAAYQRVQPLTIGELWAVAITLRIVLIENLRRLGEQMTAGQRAREDADALADRLLVAGDARTALEADRQTRSQGALSRAFAAQLARRLRDQDPNTTPALGWLEDRLELQGDSIDGAVQHEQRSKGASNVSVRNVITSMRAMDDLDWADLVEAVSVVDERLRSGSDFSAMDFPTRDGYRGAIEVLARGSACSELQVVEHALQAARRAAESTAEPEEAPRVGDPGYHLLDRGRPALERTLGFHATPRLRLGRLLRRLGVGGYVGMILTGSAGALLLASWALSTTGLPAGGRLLFVLLGAIPATEVATALVNRAVSWICGATALPAMDLADGVPGSLRTLVAVPVLLTSEDDVREHIAELEVHHLASTSGHVTFALLSDWVDAPHEALDDDVRLLACATAGIDALNRRHGPGPDGARFVLLHRRRVYNAPEGCWMGWERKRGKLHELDRLLRGATDTSFVPIAGCASAPPGDVRYVIALDADTRLPRDAVSKLVGKMAHPLNRPRFSAAQQRIIDGHAVLQPRVTPSLPVGREGSLHQRIFSSPGGIDPYAGAVSDIYQDLFGEGSYTGKGIYDVDAFEAALRGRVPDNTMLSHDLFEGIFARAGLASDVEVVETFPSRYDVAGRRQHRWMRGDWQLLPWLLTVGGGSRSMPWLGRVKMLDNLRRSLLSPFLFMAMAVCLFLPGPAGLAAAALVVAAIAIPAFLPVVLSLLPHRAGGRLRCHLRMLGGDLRLAGAHTVLSIAFLPDAAWRAGDAIARTLVRLFVTRRHMLEWTTAAQSTASPHPDAAGFYRQMAGGTALGLVLPGAALGLAPQAWPLVAPLAALWLAAPALAARASRTPPVGPRPTLPEPDARSLRLTARRTWRYFETFVTEESNRLPPDNFQEDPAPVVAQRTSPTNLGLYLLSTVAARDFGWTGTTETVERLEGTLASMRKLRRFRGHFFNWYATRDCEVLEPAYVSSVDSGNLAGHLLVLANACEEWVETPATPDLRPGIGDHVRLAAEAIDSLATADRACTGRAASALQGIESLLGVAGTLDTSWPELARLSSEAGNAALDLAPVAGHAAARDRDDASVDARVEAVFWLQALGRSLAEHDRDRRQAAASARGTAHRLRALAATARTLALEMDFAFLVDPERELLSIGFSLADNSLDPSCYDLLASEARLASMLAVAKRDVATRHWFHLGRTSTPIGSASALLSWSGSMFEYLMPALVMREPIDSLLAQSGRLAVARQQSYGRSSGTPWGVSESAFNARDLELTYQYSNFGVPGLGLKRGLAADLVVAPYATGLAAMIDPHGARRNYDRLAAIGARGAYGFYDAVDFTPSRLPEGDRLVVVRCYMAHHQGMTIIAIANALHDGRMRARFHREPMIRAAELLLQERVPRYVAATHPPAEQSNGSLLAPASGAPAVRRLHVSQHEPAVTHLLSNGRYAVMLTASGTGYSRWRDIAVTRWREDTTSDRSGTFILLRDPHAGEAWSASAQPIAAGATGIETVFSEDHAQFHRRAGSLTSCLEVLVSGEDDGEVRHLSLSNGGPGTRELEITSYAELVLSTAAADHAHPAFSKMFVQTEHLAEYDALIATRRPRSATEPRVWAAHFAIVEGEVVAAPRHETDRARFLGRGRGIASAIAMAAGQTLSNTVGTVLDPIFSLRYRVSIAPGKVVRVAFWTLVAGSRADLLNLIDRHHDRSAFERAKTLAWTQAQVQLRHLDIGAQEAANFQRLTAPILYADSRFRASPAAILRGAGAQSGLWPHAISGDLPIVTLRIDDPADIGCVRELLRAHEYWRMKCLDVDLVIVNERTSSYQQGLHNAIEAAVRSSRSRSRFGEEHGRGSVHVLRADLVSSAVRALLQSVARVVLHAGRGPVAEQLARVPAVPPAASAATRAGRSPAPRDPSPKARSAALEFFNGLGGFDAQGCEYVTVLDGGAVTPAPWINVIANPAFGFQVAAAGNGYTWAENSRENQLTPWSNDPVCDPCGETLYVRDEETLELWGPTAEPRGDGGTYVARHGYGYSRFEHEARGIALVLLQYVPVADPVKISRLSLRNVSGRPRRLTVTAYAEWVLGASRGAATAFVATELDPASGALLARNPWSIAFPGRVAFADLAGRQTSWTADRTEFLGRHGGAEAPAALARETPLSGRCGVGFDPCAALQAVVELDVGETMEIVSLLGQAHSPAAAGALVARYRTADLDAVLGKVSAQWKSLLGTVQVSTPDRAMDIMLNGWLLYQTQACRLWARSAFYQASGAYGFRDQLQDGMALTLARPRETRRHLLLAAARQFVEGDVQHWWLPHSGQGVRTRISDDRVWLAFASASYVHTTGDRAVLDEVVPFLEGPLLAAGEHDAFFQPMIGDESASLFEHCARGLEQCLEQTGEHGLPLIGTGDWNDGMNRVGEAGRGESVWLAWLLLRTVELFATLADERSAERAARWRNRAEQVREALEREAWDGRWYRRATFDDGSWLGSAQGEECRIDSIAQSWAVLSGAADPARAAQAMASLERELIRTEGALALLFAPPFDTAANDPGYIRGYPPGLRENGGQYSHAAMWAILAFARLGAHDEAASLFALVNPINHASTPAGVERYKVEPYVVAADVYSVAPHAGRGGWTWYTGAAGWMYRAGLEGILGIRREGDFLVVEPCIPAAWPGYEATVKVDATHVHVRVENDAHGAGEGPRRARGAHPVEEVAQGRARIALDGGTHGVLISVSRRSA